MHCVDGILEGVGLRAGPFEYVRVVWARWRALVLLAVVWARWRALVPLAVVWPCAYCLVRAAVWGDLHH